MVDRFHLEVLGMFGTIEPRTDIDAGRASDRAGQDHVARLGDAQDPGRSRLTAPLVTAEVLQVVDLKGPGCDAVLRLQEAVL